MSTQARVLGWTALFWLAATGAEAKNTKSKSNSKEPDHIVVQHILIGYSGSVPGKGLTRSRAEAEKLARELLAKAKKKGADFGELVTKHTDDAAPGIYKMSNKGVPQAEADEFPRERMVPAFGDVGFKLKAGEVGLATFDAQKSPYGFHIIKRLK